MHQTHKGYTLIELMVVIVLIGLFFSIAAPRFRDAVLTDSLKRDTRQLVGRITELRADAIRNHKDYLLIFDLESNTYWYGYPNLTPEGRQHYRENKQHVTNLSENVRISAISFKEKDKRISGEVELLIRKEGYVQQSAIHLEAEDGREFTILLRPFLPKVKVLEKHFEFEIS